MALLLAWLNFLCRGIPGNLKQFKAQAKLSEATHFIMKMLFWDNSQICQRREEKKLKNLKDLFKIL